MGLHSPDAVEKVGSFIRSLITGRGVEKQQSASSLIAGGVLVGDRLSRILIDLARDFSVMSQAGAVSMAWAGDAGTMTLARITSDPAVEWIAENAALTETSAAFGALTFHPRTLATLLPISIELAMDAANAEALIGDVMVRAIGAELYRAGLAGTDTGAQPLGLLNTNGVTAWWAAASQRTDGARLLTL
jgi:HK97 family phage major capsid protein